MSLSQAKAELENIKDLIQDNAKNVKELRKLSREVYTEADKIKEWHILISFTSSSKSKSRMGSIVTIVLHSLICLDEIEDNGKGMMTSLKYIENQLKGGKR